MKLPGMERLGSVGLVGERKGVALLSLGFYCTLFTMLTLSARSELPEWLPAFGAMTALYITAFMSVAAEWFWGRWFATGLGYWGTTVAIFSIIMTQSLPPAMVVFGVMHALVALCLAGEKMAARFDARPEWREKWKLDEHGVVRVRKAVTRAASSLPFLVLWALAPRQGEDAFATGVHPASMILLLVVAVLAFGVLVGTRRTWALLGLGATGLLVIWKSLASNGSLHTIHSYVDPAGLPHADCSLAVFGALGGVALVAAAVPFVLPILAFLRPRR
jgi:hypothetical protein